MTYPITPAVRLEVERSFAATEAPKILEALAATVLPLLPKMTADVERIHFAVLYLSKTNRQDFGAALEQAKSDWRDVLVGAGLAHENWPEVLSSRGITPSLSR